MKGLYIHIPFCKSICSYCDFTKRLGNNDIYEKYINRLFEEIDSYKLELEDINTVYIGGGTPNVLPLNLLEMLFKKIERYLNKSIENTIELNPELIDINLCELLQKYKFNRVSLGIQTVDDDSIKLLNRHHTKENIIDSFKYLREYGINNINCDLIFGIPNTNINTVKNDLDFILSLNPTHISYYDLIIEDRTLIKYQIENHKVNQISDDLEADMYDYINERLKTFGFKHYEVSNYAKEGFESKHNMIYWNCDDYVGVGLGASGKLNDIRYTNSNRTNAYFLRFLDESSKLSIKDKKSEFLILGTRMLKGVSIDMYKKMFKSDIFVDFPILNDLINRGLIIHENDNLRIPENKMFIANSIWRELL